MGLDLKLLPLYSNQESCNYSHDILQMERDSELFELIIDFEEEKGISVKTGGINSFNGTDKSGKWEEPCYSKTETTPYGDRMKSISAEELSDIFSSVDISDWRNKAVASYVKELPRELRIYLYWH